MQPSSVNNSPRRANPFSRHSPSPSPSPQVSTSRPKSAVLPTTFVEPEKKSHTRNSSLSHFSAVTLGSENRPRSSSLRQSVHASGTFAPQFIKAEELQRGANSIHNLEGDNDFSGKRYVWLKDPEKAFIRGEVLEERQDGNLFVQCEDGSQREVSIENADKVNPAKFDKADDMAELTHLNEASVVHNLHLRYQADLIYTYSGLFLVTVNPYCPLPIYTNEYVRMYKGQSREDTRPHIFAMADLAFRNLVEEGENQSILVTGESGAGKTENTKKVIQYLAAVATPESSGTRSGKAFSNLSQQILRANPILEAFGNAQTVRNNNSSRFGKFIRIEFTRSGQISGAYIDWYLLEKSRVVKPGSRERNYHVFYQLLQGSDKNLRSKLLLADMQIEDFAYTRDGNDSIAGVSDVEEWKALMEAFQIMNFSENDRMCILRTVAAVLYLGNITVTKERVRGDQAALTPEAYESVHKACQLLGVDSDSFVKGLLHPRVKAGREWVEKVQTPEQVRLALDALAKGIYERGFGDLVNRINNQLDMSSSASDDTYFIGVLDIAGFEIFESNSFEQLCINYTNEKLQQFFNHHMFVLEQEEYAREQIEWQFIDFGKDLQPTIDLIELTNPIGIFSCLDEDCVMPKATDKTFTEKLHSLWDRNSPKYRASRLSQGFVLTHYAAEVEYTTEGWLEKNKDPLNDNITRLLSGSTDKHICNLFSDYVDTDDEQGFSRSRVKKGLFRTVAQRHKDQLSSLMNQLHSTHPHFVRCILPNHKKKPKQFNGPLVLDQLRCNGVLEGIRIARTGFPNRLSFNEFRQRYEVLCRDMPKGYLEGQSAAHIMLNKLGLDKSWYRVGLTKVFFRAGVLAELEEKRDALIREIMTLFQSAARGFVQRRIANKRLYRAEATRIIQKNFHVYLALQRNPWWRLFTGMKPLLGATRTAAEVKKRDEKISQLEAKVQQDLQDRHKLEEERRRAELEISRVKKTLESERALALDKEEIFKRLQIREVELSEKLAEAIADQENLEGQLDELIEAKRKAEEQLEARKVQLEQAGQIIVKLEADKKQLQERLTAMDSELKEMENTHSQRDVQVQDLTQEKKMLQSQLSLKERKLQDLETKLLKSDQNLDVKLAKTSKELEASRIQVKNLFDENKAIRQEIAELSKTSTGYEEMIRRKEGELVVLRNDAKRYEEAKKSLEVERQSLGERHDNMQKRLRDLQAEMDATKSEKLTLEREAADVKRMLEAKMTEDAEAGHSRRLLEQQVQDLKAQLFQLQADLSRERQSRDDVQMLGEHKLAELKGKYESLNEAKITIEKEMYIQQDTLRRATEARTAAEQARKDLQAELIRMRERFANAEKARLDAESHVERNLIKQANEKQAALREELDIASSHLQEVEGEKSRLSIQVQELTQMLADSENFRERHDQQKERLERELVTIKGRLAASENDNRALLNKIQQKNLEISRSNSKASDNQRSRIVQLQNEKAKLEEEQKKVQRQLGDAQVTITSLEKQKEKLALTVEDLNHEVAREHKASRKAESASSTMTLQLAEANRNLETERQMRNQAQANTRQLQTALDQAHKEIEDCHQQLMLLHKVFDPEVDEASKSWEAIQPDLSKKVDLAQLLELAHRDLRVSEERYSRAESQLVEMRQRHEGEIKEMDARYSSSKRALLEEIDNNQVSTSRSPTHIRKNSENAKRFSNPSTPNRRFNLNEVNQDSGRSDRTVDTTTYQKRMDMATELEELQNKLQMTEMQNRHLQNQLELATPSRDMWQEDSPSIRRVQLLERENGRLHEKLDDSAKKVSALERMMQTGELSLRDVQAKSHEELFDLLNSQEQSRKSLLNVNKNAIAELTEAKSQFEKLKRSKTALEVELRDARSDLQDAEFTREQEAASRNQLLQEFSDLQIRLDAEESKVIDLTSSLSLYKSRADEYFSKLEQAEIAVLKAARAEQFAKSQAKEAEETCAMIMAERQRMDSLVEDLQRQVQSYEEKVEDLSADLEGALQGKRRLQNELEDYRNHRASEIEDKEASLEQTRKKYQREFATIANELEIERENLLHVRDENSRLREELEDLRSKWDNEVLNSSTWAKEKSRLEMTLQDVSSSRDEAIKAHNDAQSKVVSLLSQVRNLRTSVDDITSERDLLAKDKKVLESRLKEATDRLEDLANGDSPSMRDAAGMDREILELKSKLAQHEDVSAAAVGKMRRAEALSVEMQKELVAEREANATLFKEKASLEKQLKEVQLRCVDLETKGFSSASQDIKFLHKRVKELETQLEEQESKYSAEQRSTRNVDRTVKDLQSQIERRDKINSQLTDDINKSRDKIERLLQTIDELQSSDSQSQLQAKRAERELREEREKALRLERELEGWKQLRVERGSIVGRANGLSDVASRRGSGVYIANGTVEVPQRKFSNTKGFI
ncbi:myosin type II heavy chain, putative [Talaromyces stipitatus ATCC 10500]|uniref:Myosin type II heavy chain, putative n=1 Tax=Talaromyces stipitatus (strain ATCC 10500 / CBS 375.48 / QM 6759 / NRRL 1006) TaxID=441959 RepID=B8MDB1_TALSN|nr:myosin type II heavy chain, putative [Talaromyces stipitatus ATCC 10500]EED17636.1 myosin type II heavy chain, putative [Talaromyces stipitatus ATCC 10500]